MLSTANPNAQTVTVVDDEPSTRDVLVRAARSWSYECQTASTAEQAVVLLEKQPTPVVVTDLRMPGRGGVWLVQEIQRRWPDIAVIVTTAGQDADAVTDCFDAGAHHYLLKPIQLDEFRHALAATHRNWLLQRDHLLYRRQLERKVLLRTRQLRGTFLSAIASLVKTLEARDPYTKNHSINVRALAVQLARVVGLPDKQCKQISLAAKLHDLGKIGLSEAILNKPGRLTEEEMRQVREHPVIGVEILSPIIRSKTVLAAIRGHHERLDGGGYPDGLAGDDIAMEARVIAIADCFDAITSCRAYRMPLPRKVALELIRAGAGTQFDARLVNSFLNLHFNS